MPASTQGLSDIAIKIAPGFSPDAPASSLIWQDAGSRRTAADIVITAGRDDESSENEAGSLSALMDDRDGNLSPRNVNGQWYGSLKRGTPAGVHWPRLVDSFARTASNGWGTTPDGFTWTMSSSSAYSVDGTRGLVELGSGGLSRARITGAGSPDVELLWSTTLPVAPTGASFVSAGLVRHADANNYIRAHTEFQAPGTVIVKIQRLYQGAQTDLLGNTSTGLTFSAGDKFWTRVRAEGKYILVRTWKDGTTEPTTWQGSATDTDLESAEVGLVFWRLNTNAGTYTAYIDDFSVVNLLWSGNVPEWPPRWPNKLGEAESTIQVTGAGILRRLQQGSSQLISPLRRQLSGLPYGYAYYPCEDATGSTSVASGLSGASPATVQGSVSFAGDDTLGGGDAALVLSQALTSRVLGEIPNAGQSTTGGYAMLVLFRCDSAVATGGTLLEVKCAKGVVATWQIYVNATDIGFRALDNSGTQLVGFGAAYAPEIDMTEWVAVQLETAGGTGSQSVTLIWNQVGQSVWYSLGGTVPGATSFLRSFKAAAITDSMSIGHLWFGDEALPFVDYTFSAVSGGYVGEAASDRIARLCAETGVPVAVLAGDSEAMGPQRSAKLVDLLRECATADQGILYERGNSLAYRPRSRRYNVAVAMALDWDLGHLSRPPEPTDDDQRLRNRWKVNRTGGSSATVTDESGPLGTSEVGLYDDELEVNVQYDSRLTDFAGWLVNLGTNDELRWPRIAIDLVAHPELIPSWLACSIGSRITIAHPPSQIAGEVIDLIIEGYTQTINVDKWIVEMSCSPARPWQVGTYGSSDSSGDARYDSPSTTLQSEVSAAGTTLVLEFALPSEGWTTRSASFPLDLLIAGERITVPAASNMGAITGAGPCTQTITGATRAVNGISKILPAGSEVHVATPGRYAL